MSISRRALLGLGAAGALAACSTDSHSSAPTASPGTSSSTPSATSTPTASSSPSEAALPTVTAWQPYGNDLEPACKRAAVRRIESAGNGADRALQVVFAQYGGLLSTTASVLVVCRSWARSGTSIVSGGHTFDVRLHKTGQTWKVDTVNPSRPGAPATPSPTARKVLTSDRIDLPPAARADVRSGQVHDSALTAMLALAQDYRIGISVVRSGHPTYVFGTDRLSDHPQGRAFDTWRIDGHPVVAAQTSRALVTEYMHAAAATGSYNVGGPYLLGSAPQYFSDDTHHDHVHAGFAS